MKEIKAEQLPPQPFSSLAEVMDHSSSLKRQFIDRIQAHGSEEIKRVLRIEKELRRGGQLPRLTETYLDLGARRLLSDVYDLFCLVGYTPKEQSLTEKSGQEKAQERLQSTTSRLVGDTLPQVTLALINICQEHQIPLTDVGGIFDSFGPIEPKHFVGGLRYNILPKEQVGELLGKTWGEIAEILVLQSAAREENDWQCYLTACREAEEIAQAVGEVASQTDDLPHFIQGAFRVLAERVEENRVELSPLVRSSLPHHLEETQKILSLLAMGVKGALKPSEEGEVFGEDERRYVCLSNLASFESFQSLIEVLGGKAAEGIIYYVDPNHINELRLRLAEYSLRFKREPLHLTTLSTKKGRLEPKWPIITTKALEGPKLVRRARGRLSKMGIKERAFATLAGIMKSRLSLYKEAMRLDQEMPVPPREFLRYHWNVIVFLSNVAGHSTDSAQAMGEVEKFVNNEAPLKKEGFEVLRKHLVRMAGFSSPGRFFLEAEAKEAPLLENFHDFLIELADSLEEIGRQAT